MKSRSPAFHWALSGRVSLWATALRGVQVRIGQEVQETKTAGSSKSIRYTHCINIHIYIYIYIHMYYHGLLSIISNHITSNQIITVYYLMIKSSIFLTAGSSTKQRQRLSGENSSTFFVFLFGLFHPVSVNVGGFRTKS